MLEKSSRKLNSLKLEVKRNVRSSSTKIQKSENTNELKQQIESLTQEVKALKEIANSTVKHPQTDNQKIDTLVQQVEKLITATSNKYSKVW